MHLGAEAVGREGGRCRRDPASGGGVTTQETGEGPSVPQGWGGGQDSGTVVSV